jgi:hypothetical protein
MKTLTLDQALFIIAARPDLALQHPGRAALSGWVVAQRSLGDRESPSTSGEMAAKAEAMFLELARAGKLTVLDEVDGELRHVEPRWFEDATFHYGGPPDFRTTLQRTDWDGSREMTEGGAVLTSHSVRTISGRVNEDQLEAILKLAPATLKPEKPQTGKVPLVIEQLKTMYPAGVPDPALVPRKDLQRRLIDTTPALGKKLDEATLKKAIDAYNASLQRNGE